MSLLDGRRRATCPWVGAAAAVAAVVVAAACGSGKPTARTDVPEPAMAPPTTTAPVGQVVRIGGDPEGMVADPFTGLVAVGVRAPDGVSVGDRPRAGDGPLPMPTQPGGVATNGRTVAVVGVRGRRMELIGAASMRPVGTVACGVGPTRVVGGPDGRYYVADTQGDRVIVYEDQPQLRQLGTTDAKGAPYGITVDPGRKHLWVTLTARNQVVEYDIAGRLPRRVATFATMRQPNSLAVDPPTGLVFVSGATADGEVQVLHP